MLWCWLLHMHHTPAPCAVWNGSQIWVPFHATIQGKARACRAATPGVGRAQLHTPLLTRRSLTPEPETPGMLDTLHAWGPMRVVHQGTTWSLRASHEKGSLTWSLFGQPSRADRGLGLRDKVLPKQAPCADVELPAIASTLVAPRGRRAWRAQPGGCAPAQP